MTSLIGPAHFFVPLNKYSSTVRQLFLIVLLLIGSLASFTGYCMALIDWVQDVNSSRYATNYAEILLETSALLLYGYLAIRFMKSKLNV